MTQPNTSPPFLFLSLFSLCDFLWLLLVSEAFLYCLFVLKDLSLCDRTSLVSFLFRCHLILIVLLFLSLSLSKSGVVHRCLYQHYLRIALKRVLFCLFFSFGCMSCVVPAGHETRTAVVRVSTCSRNRPPDDLVSFSSSLTLSIACCLTHLHLSLSLYYCTCGIVIVVRLRSDYRWERRFRTPLLWRKATHHSLV